jgi:hypothetical protein
MSIREFFPLYQWRAAIRLEAKGLQHRSGRSVTARARKELGLPRSASRQAVLEAINWGGLRAHRAELRTPVPGGPATS